MNVFTGIGSTIISALLCVSAYGGLDTGKMFVLSITSSVPIDRFGINGVISESLLDIITCYNRKCSEDSHGYIMALEMQLRA